MVTVSSTLADRLAVEARVVGERRLLGQRGPTRSRIRRLDRFEIERQGILAILPHEVFPRFRLACCSSAGSAAFALPRFARARPRQPRPLHGRESPRAAPPAPGSRDSRWRRRRKAAAPSGIFPGRVAASPRPGCARRSPRASSFPLARGGARWPAPGPCARAHAADRGRAPVTRTSRLIDRRPGAPLPLLACAATAAAAAERPAPRPLEVRLASSATTASACGSRVRNASDRRAPVPAPEANAARATAIAWAPCRSRSVARSASRRPCRTASSAARTAGASGSRLFARPSSRSAASHWPASSIAFTLSRARRSCVARSRAPASMAVRPRSRSPAASPAAGSCISASSHSAITVAQSSCAAASFASATMAPAWLFTDCRSASRARTRSASAAAAAHSGATSSVALK